MKKIIITAISLLTLILVTSCTNEEILIEKVGRKYNLALNVSTQGLYDQFDLTYSIRENYLRDGSRQIGVFTFVYDEKGDLIQKEQRYLNNFNTTNIQLYDLIEGQYTIVTVETLVNPDDNFSIESFTLDDDEKLSTLKITNKKELDKNGIEWPVIANAPEVIGTSSNKVFLLEDMSLDINPLAIGSVVGFMHYNWEKTEIVTIGWATNDVLNYYSLNPSLNKDARYNKDLATSGKTNVRRIMNVNDNPEIYYGVYVLEKDMVFKIVYQDSDNQGTGKVYVTKSQYQPIKDGQQYYIGTYLGADNSIYYNLFENVTELNNWKIELDNTVGPYGKTGANLYTIPYTNWSEGTVSAVKNYMTGISLSEDITLQDNGNYRLTYFDPSNGGILYWYDFKTRTTGLTDSYVIVSKESVTLDKVISELKNEGYELVTQEEDEYLFVNSNQTTAVYMYDIGTLIVINYYDPSAYTSSSSRSYQQKKQNIREKNISFPQSNNNKMLKSLFKTQSEITMKSDIYKIEMVQLR